MGQSALERILKSGRRYGKYKSCSATRLPVTQRNGSGRTVTPGDRELVLDASVLVKWFHPDQEANVEGALRLLTEYENAELQVVVPPLLYTSSS